ncbi:MAG: ferredoxin [Candidatus Sabulitectum sp.]|nr:ferredoxin [Candidatus Sabulitectum sp.]
MKKYTVSEECIGCRACVEVAAENFDVDENKIAYLKKQPGNKEEEANCRKALEVCPVEAISLRISDNQLKPIVASSNIKATLDSHPELKQVLADLSPKFKRMQNPALYNTLARFANFRDAAKVTGLSVCEILHTINEYMGTAEELQRIMPDCIKETGTEDEYTSVDIYWQETAERYIYNENTLEEIVRKVSDLPPQNSIVIISVEEPGELLKIADGLKYQFNMEKNREYRISIYNPEIEEQLHWLERKEEFEVLDVRTMTTDPFDVILKKAYSTRDNGGFVLIQHFEPAPMISMLSEMSFEHITEEKATGEFWIYFHKKPVSSSDIETFTGKVDAVIQSATPVGYPVMMRLLQSEKIRKHINIKELKVWDETEKHLAWITNGKADISFSALITAAKLRNSDIKIPALFVWDNFVLLSRGKVKNFGDIKDREIHVPLFEEAPPAKITKYLIKASGFDPDEFVFRYGKPFGRPEEIYKDFVTGNADTVVLREPEASYAIKIMEDRNTEISVLPFNTIWNSVNEGFGSFPNAGLVIKGEFARKHPQECKVFLEELESAIQWVNHNRKAAAELSFDMMRQPVDRVELFLDRVKFEYVEGEKLEHKVKQYFDILDKNGVVNMDIDDEFLSIFRMQE